jgi:2'-5' RNA ligase
VKVRTFVALELSESLKAGILALGTALRAGGVRASWLRPDAMHLTLKFLGDVEEGALPDVIEGVRLAASRTPAFRFRTTMPGAFPSPRRPRVIWLGVEPVDELFGLWEALEAELSCLGFERERRPFRPHITIGRIRSPGAAGDLTRLLAELERPEETVDVRDVRVVKSTLKPSGAVHEVLEALPLRGEHTPVDRGRR